MDDGPLIEMTDASEGADSPWLGVVFFLLFLALLVLLYAL
ncbi:hypothetical protein GCM10009037_21860 [Halarchaeum grantii]|uniref:Uncharacterized protein n=1 Tax=Halarchaeum grantii TaxID=1193105 RepID=A0A830F4H3_9EURY|nr:hypothetical protein GCM10009037_21860 [Halarchaeum grantii]